MHPAAALTGATRPHTRPLNPSQSGSIFEHWATQNVYQHGMGRWSRATSGLPGSYHTARITTDNLVSNPSGWTIVDYKHLREAGEFSGHQVSQLENYAEMLHRGVTHDGKPFTHVEYLFSTEEAARVNSPLIRGTLGQRRVTVYYVDATTGARSANCRRFSSEFIPASPTKTQRPSRHPRRSSST